MKMWLFVMSVLSTIQMSQTTFGESAVRGSALTLTQLSRSVQAEMMIVANERKGLDRDILLMKQLFGVFQRTKPSIEFDQILLDATREHQTLMVSVERHQAALDHDEVKLLGAYWRSLTNGATPTGRRPIKELLRRGPSLVPSSHRPV